MLETEKTMNSLLHAVSSRRYIHCYNVSQIAAKRDNKLQSKY